MTDTLSDVVLALGQLLGGMAYGVATGGSTTTIVDTTRIEGDDYWNRGTALIVTAGAAAPEGQFSIISDWVNSTSTATIAAVTATVAAADTYALIPPRWPLEMLKNKINLVLRTIKIPQIDTTSLDTADNQTLHDLPTTIPAHNLRRVWVETMDDADDPQWYEIRDWRVYVQPTGTADKLVIPQWSSGWDIRLDYVTPHPLVDTYDDEISEAIHVERILYHAALMCVVEEIGADKSYKGINTLANFYQTLALQAEVEHPVVTPQMNGRITTYVSSVGSEYTGEPGKVRL